LREDEVVQKGMIRFLPLKLIWKLKYLRQRFIEAGGHLLSADDVLCEVAERRCGMTVLEVPNFDIKGDLRSGIEIGNIHFDAEEFAYLLTCGIAVATYDRIMYVSGEKPPPNLREKLDKLKSDWKS